MNSMTNASSFLLTFPSTSSSSSPSSSSPSSIFSKSQIYPPPPSSSSSSPSLSRFACRSQLNSREDLPFILHDTLQTSGIDITHAKEAREGFVSQIKRLSKIERQISIAINARANLAKTALFIAAEDDALVSHSSVPLPVESFIERLDALSMGFVSYYSLNLRSASPEVFIDGLESYLYGYKGFRRAPASDLPESRALYLNSVLTHRSGSAVMLSLIYSEILKMLHMWGLLNYDVEISCPHDQVNLPKGYHKQKSRDSDQRFILTQQSLLVEILRSLKEVFWPFRYDPSRSLFLRAAWAAKCISGPTTVETAFERASSKAAQHRLERGVWTSVRLGDMRRALSASERLILLDHDVDELRDYSILLYHCGFYEESWHYLNLYMNSTISPKSKRFTSKLEQMEDEAVEELKTRLNLILMEDNLTKPSNFRNFLGSHSEPW